MRRDEAVDILARAKLPRLDVEKRASLLFGFWGIDEDDAEWHTLPPRLRAEMAVRDEPGPAEAEEYEPLLLVALRYEYVGVLNSYLEAALAREGRPGIRVEGEVERLFACPCCRYRTLELVRGLRDAARGGGGGPGRRRGAARSAPGARHPPARRLRPVIRSRCAGWR
jgi:hypothetical protein